MHYEVIFGDQWVIVEFKALVDSATPGQAPALAFRKDGGDWIATPGTWRQVSD